jgi:hypothetical protein
MQRKNPILGHDKARVHVEAFEGSNKLAEDVAWVIEGCGVTCDQGKKICNVHSTLWGCIQITKIWEQLEHPSIIVNTILFAVLPRFQQVISILLCFL